MANTIVLLAVILPAIASLSFIRLLKDFPLGLTKLDCLLSIVIRAVLALADLGIALKSISEADAIHLLALTLRAGALLLFHFNDGWLRNFCRCNFGRNVLRRLEDLGHLLVHVEIVLVGDGLEDDWSLLGLLWLEVGHLGNAENPWLDRRV